MTQEKLSNLAILSIEPTFVNQVLTEDRQEMIDTFSEKAGRNSVLLISHKIVLVDLCISSFMFIIYVLTESIK